MIANAFHYQFVCVGKFAMLVGKKVGCATVLPGT